MKQLYKFIFASCVLVSTTSLPANAQIAPGDEKFLIHIGYFLPSFTTKLGIASDTLGRGDEVSIEDDLGLDTTQNVVRTDVSWRFAEKHRVELGYFVFNRNGEKTLTRELQIGDEVFPVSATINTSFKFQIVPFYYYYSFIKTPEMELAGGLGLQWSTMKASIIGSSSLGNEDASRDAEATADGPLPLISADFVYYFNPKWDFGVNIGLFSYKTAQVNKTYQGNVATATISTDYWFADNFGVGAALNWFALDVDVEARLWNGTMNYQYWGPQLFLSAKF
ncbi:hypothetical protein [Bdellovibrio sp. HCB337]|uniref:hypothetical protein n=1 Tax=Bdellovibrio sp. HCB337 TaxID=3394358 RepID=UPI0039A5008C